MSWLDGVYNWFRKKDNEMIERNLKRLNLIFNTQNFSDGIFCNKSISESLELINQFLIKSGDSCIISYDQQFLDERLFKVYRNDNGELKFKILDPKYVIYNHLFSKLSEKFKYDGD